MARIARYTEEQLAEAVSTSYSVMEVMRKIGMKLAGGSHHHISGRIKKLGLDTSHFTRQAHNRGKTSPRRLTTEQICVILPEGSRRPRRQHLLRVMFESGLTYQCSECSIESWQGKKIVLDIDHIDGNWLNNMLSNLRFLCPNCHSQTETFGSKNNTHT